MLQTGEFERLGSSQTRKVDVRIISATNANLQKAIAAGSFREDLYFRLNVIELYVPPLSERVDDIVLLAEEFLRGFATGALLPRLSDDSRAALVAYDWPGNVRELMNRIQRATLVCQGGVITPGDLGLGPGGTPGRSGSQPAQAAPTAAPERPVAAAPASASASGSEPERDAIEDALVRAKGVVAKAAAELGMSRQALYRRMEKLGIVLERRPRP